jgi:hypothetical protein
MPSMMNKDVLDPAITATARCHGCNEIVLLGTRQCPYCEMELDQKEMQARALKSVKIDQAITSANTIRTFNPAIFLLFIIALLRLVMDFGFQLNLYATFLWFLPAVTIVLWFIKHGGWKSFEEDYLTSKKAMKMSLLGWLAGNVLNWITFYVSAR